MKRIVLFLILLNSFSSALAQKKVYVDAGNIDKPIFILDGTTWSNAYSTLQFALEKNIGVENVEYHIAGGEYRFSNQGLNYSTTASFFGGYDSGGSENPTLLKPTIIYDSNITFKLNKNRTQTIQNIAFGGGKILVFLDAYNISYGSPITFLNVLFAGISFEAYACEINLTKVVFNQCKSIMATNVLFNIENCDFINNTTDGLQISGDGKIHNCIFENNQGNGLTLGTSNTEISKCLFKQNSADGFSISTRYSNTNNGISAKLKLKELVSSNNSRNGCTIGGTLMMNLEDIECSNNLLNGIELEIFDEDKNYAKVDSIQNLTSTNNGDNGLRLYYTNGSLDLSDCNFSNNGKNGIDKYYLGILRMNMKNSLVNNNKGTGINMFGAQLFVKLSEIEFSKNWTGADLRGQITSFEVNNCLFSNNINSGLSLGSESQSTFNVISSRFENNTIGLVTSPSNLKDIVNIKKCHFVNNEYKPGNTLISDESYFKSSSGIFWLGGQLNIDASEFIGNKAKGKNSGVEGNGGAIYNKFGSKTIITNSYFHNNSSTGAGGTIFSDQSSLSVYNSVFAQNISSNQGGAIMVSDKQTKDTEIVNCTFFDNTTYDLDGGGAISNNSTRAVNVKNSIFYKNKQNKANNIFSSDIYTKTGPLNINSTILQLDSLKYKTTPNINFIGIGNFYNQDPRFLLPKYLEDSVKTLIKGNDLMFGTNDDALRLRNDSPFLNVGVNSFNATSENPSGLDVAGNERIQEFVIDLGAYEGGVKVVHVIPQTAPQAIAQGSTTAINLIPITDYGNPVTYTLASGPATLKDNVITPTGKPGKIIVTGKANGTEKDGIINICVNPSKPSITLRDVEGDFFLKSSSETGNVWYNNNKKTNLTTQEITAVYDSYYTLQIDIDGCVSTVSEKTVIPKDKIHVISAVVLNDINEGSEKSFDLPTKTDLGNTINYTLTGPATIQNGKLTVGNKPGLVEITAKANKAPNDVNYKFCVIPNKPTISLIEKSGVYTIKSSSAGGNVWFKENTKITSSSQEIPADYEAVYTLQSDFGGCLSEISESITIPKLVILGFDELDNTVFSIYPVPASDKLSIVLNKDVKFKTLKLVDSNGREFLKMDQKNISDHFQISLLPYPAGVYQIVLETDTLKVTKKVIKQ